MAYTPEKISIEQAEAEVREAWTRAYSPKAIANGLRIIRKRPMREKTIMFFARLAFRGIYFPQMRRRHWVYLIWRNRQPLISLCYEAFRDLMNHKKAMKGVVDGKSLAAIRK
jgi:hypothetical protein